MKLDSDIGGMNQYLHQAAGFRAIIKHRFSDFIVNEIDTKDQIVNLKSLEPIQLIKKDAELVVDDDETGIAKLQSLIPDTSVMDQLKQMITSKNDPPMKVQLKSDDKATRTQIHTIIKTYFNKIISSSTDHDGCITFQGANTKSNRSKERLNWNETGDYCHFTLFKENKDTMEAVDVLCRQLRCQSKIFGYSGTKDKRGVTTQRISAFRIPPQRLAGLNKTLKGMKLGDFKYEKTPLKLGDLNGNRFKIALRDIQPQDRIQEMTESLESLKKNGFINYYGMQRFGTYSIPTYIVGISCLSGNFAEAVNTILSPKEEDKENLKLARSYWFDEKDAKKACDAFPRRSIAERAILQYFSKKDRQTDFLGAIMSIPRNLRLLYVHSYQSFVWNSMASERIRLYGNELVIGDLVSTETCASEEEVSENSNLAEKVPEVQLIETAEDLQKFTMEDLVLPLPGHSIMYPKNAIYEKYVQFMGEHGFDPANMVRKQREFSLPGSYRKVIGKPKNMSWKFMKYTDDTINLMETDLDLIEGRLAEGSPLNCESSQDSYKMQPGEYLALTLDFCLNSSTYATMALRELMKTETGASYHASLTDALKTFRSDTIS